MIKHLKYNQIDFDLYDHCVRNSSFPTLYAAPWYLDIVSGNDWELLVAGNYDAVMPLPYGRAKQTFLMRRIIQPLFCQQLGLFAGPDVATRLQHELIAKFFTLNPFAYHFNYTNWQLLKDYGSIKPRTNFVLSLDQNPDVIVSSFSTNLRRNIRKAEKTGLDFRLVGKEVIPELIALKKAAMQAKLSEKSYKRMETLMNASIERNLGFICGVYANEDLIASAFILKSFDRIIYLIAAKSQDAEQNGAAHYLLYNLIKDSVLKHNKLDFEGSDQEGIARFFKSFGSTEEKYWAFS